MEISRVVTNNQTKFFYQREAEALADAQRKADPEWTYTVSKASDGMYYVAVFDEDGEHVGVL